MNRGRRDAEVMREADWSRDSHDNSSVNGRNFLSRFE